MKKKVDYLEYNELKLVELVDVEVLQKIQDAFSEMTEEHFSDAKVYYAVIPDKNYFAAEENGIPTYDYERLHAILEENMNGISYIDLYDLLKMEDYYATDLHWRQESIVDVAEYF